MSNNSVSIDIPPGAPACESSQPGGAKKITTKDVEKIFRASATEGAVNQEQIDRIKTMHAKISDGVDFGFNYCNLLMVANIVAALGLATDSATTVISSMLLSPIMGPVIGMSYGLIIWDTKLIWRSARNEVCSIIICILFGLLIGALTSWTEMATSWPTNEMISRGTRTTFLAGIPIAFFSGVGVSLSVLDDSTSSLVGVAISASLLPPAVNAGMLWVFSAIEYAEWAEVKNTSGANFKQMGFNSLFLTIVNVLMVWLGATLMFRAKEVLPLKKKRIFWEDLKTARRIYQKRAIDETGQVVSAADHIPERENDDPMTLGAHKTANEINHYIKRKKSKSRDEDGDDDGSNAYDALEAGLRH